MVSGFNINWTVLELVLKEGEWKASRGGLHVFLHAHAVQQTSLDEKRANHGMTENHPYGLMCRHWQASVALAWESFMSCSSSLLIQKDLNHVWRRKRRRTARTGCSFDPSLSALVSTDASPEHPQQGMFEVQEDRHPSIVLSSDLKPRLKWTRELHALFVDAVNQLGGHESRTFSALILLGPHLRPSGWTPFCVIYAFYFICTDSIHGIFLVDSLVFSNVEATPKAIMKIMRVRGLTLYHLKSHLQKYRMNIISGREAARREAEEEGEQKKEAATSSSPQEEDEVDKAEDETKDQSNAHLKIDKIEKHIRICQGAQERYLKAALDSAHRAAARETLGCAGADVDLTGLTASRTLPFPSVIKQFNLWPAHSSDMVRTGGGRFQPHGLGNSSSTQGWLASEMHSESCKNDLGLPVDGCPTIAGEETKTNAGGEENKTVQDTEVDPASIYLNLDDTGIIDMAPHNPPGSP
ncbi:hypothetical protein AAG906_027236 [Vitis piasezkii]